MNVLARLRLTSREMKLFILASFAIGIAYSMFDSVFNNFLNDQFSLTGFQRSFLEFPRELPGFLVVFISAGLWFLSNRRLAAITMMLGTVGLVLMGLVGVNYALVVFSLFVYSLGQHIFLPVSATIGMDLAHQGQDGRRLGQFNAVRNVAVILGGFAVFVGFKYLGLNYKATFIIASLALMGASFLLFKMGPGTKGTTKTYLKLHPEYRLFYFLSVLSGSRKQLFLTFAPWVLVTIFKQPTQIIATLLTVGGVIGVLFQPLLGWAIDRFGERFVLASEAFSLIFICFGYGFAKSLLPEATAFVVVCACYLLDQMVFAVSIARSTYMKKIARRPDDVQPALAASVTIDHVFSITAALVGGLIWRQFGFQYVFLMGMGIAVVNLVAALQVKIPTTVNQPAAVSEGTI